VKGVKTEIQGMVTLSNALKNETGLNYFDPAQQQYKQVSFRSIESTLLAYRNANKYIEH